jgi:hypothetical protein
MHKMMSLALAAAVTATFAGASSADEINDIKVFQRGHAEVIVDTWGPNSTTVTQAGGGRARVSVEGAGNETHVFTGICPPGSPGRAIDVRGNNNLNVVVVPCR